MPKIRKKSDLPQKICLECGFTFIWRKKWERSWSDIKFCSERCKKSFKSKKLVKKLFEDLGPRFKNRPGGYLRILKSGCTLGDASPQAYVELTEKSAPTN